MTTGLRETFSLARRGAGAKKAAVSRAGLRWVVVAWVSVFTVVLLYVLYLLFVLHASSPVVDEDVALRSRS